MRRKDEEEEMGNKENNAVLCAESAEDRVAACFDSFSVKQSEEKQK